MIDTDSECEISYGNYCIIKIEDRRKSDECDARLQLKGCK